MEDRGLFDRIKIEAHMYNPYANTMLGIDMDIHTVAGFIHVAMRQFSLYRRKTVKKKNNQMLMTLGNNCLAFDEIRYELNSGD